MERSSRVGATFFVHGRASGEVVENGQESIDLATLPPYK